MFHFLSVFSMFWTTSDFPLYLSLPVFFQLYWLCYSTTYTHTRARAPMLHYYESLNSSWTTHSLKKCVKRVCSRVREKCEERARQMMEKGETVSKKFQFIFSLNNVFISRICLLYLTFLLQKNRNIPLFFFILKWQHILSHTIYTRIFTALSLSSISLSPLLYLLNPWSESK